MDKKEYIRQGWAQGEVGWISAILAPAPRTLWVQKILPVATNLFTIAVGSRGGGGWQVLPIGLNYTKIFTNSEKYLGLGVAFATIGLGAADELDVATAVLDCEGKETEEIWVIWVADSWDWWGGLDRCRTREGKMKSGEENEERSEGWGENEEQLRERTRRREGKKLEKKKKKWGEGGLGFFCSFRVIAVRDGVERVPGVKKILNPLRPARFYKKANRACKYATKNRLLQVGSGNSCGSVFNFNSHSSILNHHTYN
jgi:hypothetical protein